MTNQQDKTIENAVEELVYEIERCVKGNFTLNEEDIKKALTKTLTTIREEVLKEVDDILVDEISLSHTTKSGKTSRLISAFNRIRAISKR